MHTPRRCAGHATLAALSSVFSTLLSQSHPGAAWLGRNRPLEAVTPLAPEVLSSARNTPSITDRAPAWRIGWVVSRLAWWRVPTEWVLVVPYPDDDVRSILMAGAGVATPVPEGESLPMALGLPAVPTRSLDAYALAEVLR